jgi:hypothetical protein
VAKWNWRIDGVGRPAQYRAALRGRAPPEPQTPANSAPPQSAEIAQHDDVAGDFAVGEYQERAIGGPIEIEGVSRSEFCQLPWFLSAERLIPEVVCSFLACKVLERVAVRRPVWPNYSRWRIKCF